MNKLGWGSHQVWAMASTASVHTYLRSVTPGDVRVLICSIDFR